MEKIKLIILFIFSFYFLDAQEINGSLVLNSRNPSTGTKFDYYSKAKVSYTTKDTNNLMKIMGNYERTNGNLYYSYSGLLESKYCNIEYYKNTSKKVEYLNSAIYYPIYKKYVSIGYSLLYYGEYRNSIYVKYNYKFIDFDISFLNRINKISLDVNPWHKWIGVNLDILYIENDYKWNFGLTLKSKFVFKSKIKS